MDEGVKEKNFGEFAEKYQQIKYVLDESDICAFIAKFFHSNPRAMDTMEGLTVWCFKRNSQGIKEALMQLQSLGIIEEIRLGETKLYTYTKDHEIREMLNGYFSTKEKEEPRYPFWPGQNNNDFKQ